MLSVGAYCGLWMVVDVQSEPHSLPPVLISPGEDRKEIHHYGLLSTRRNTEEEGILDLDFDATLEGGNRWKDNPFILGLDALGFPSLLPDRIAALTVCPGSY